MSEDTPELRIVDGLELPETYRSVYRPGEIVKDLAGRSKRLPRFFYEIPERSVAWETDLTPHFALGELVRVDVKEAEILREYPRYVPCAVMILATYLERFREKCNASVYISVNGGYRSPGHGGNRGIGPHCWGAGADIYRIGSTILDDRASIEEHREIALTLGPEVNVYPYGHEGGQTDDHLHVDLGYMHLVPAEFEDDGGPLPPQTPPERRQVDRRV